MHAFLFVGGVKQERKKAIEKKLREWRVGTFDQISIPPASDSIGIKDIRQFQSRLLLTPFQSPVTVGLIYNADSLTVQAQQALLKTVEEPPNRVRIILETTSADLLLPTIVSRCMVINLGSSHEFTKEEVSECLKILERLEKSSIAARLAITGEIAKTREDAVYWVDLATVAGRKLLEVNNSYAVALLTGLVKARLELSVNVNPKLVLDNLVLSF